MNAQTRKEARALVLGEGLMPLELDVTREAQQRERISLEQVAVGLHILADLFDAGLSMSRALTVFGGLASENWRPALPYITRSVREGRTFAEALRDAPIAVPPVVIGIISAGESGAGLAQAVRSASELTARTAQTRAAVKAALTYPAVLALAGTASIALLVGMVLPRFTVILEDLGQELPRSTQMLIAISRTSGELLLPAMIVAVISAVALHGLLTTERGRRMRDLALLNVPVTSTISAAAASARMCATLSALLKSGVALPAALGHAGRASGNAVIEERVSDARKAILRGESLGKALSDRHAVTPTCVGLISAGENAGRLSEMLAHASRIEQERADRIIHRLVKLLEPLLVLTFASIVGLVAMALLQAVYSVRPGA